MSGMALFFSGLLFGAAIVFLWMFRAEGIRLRKNLYLVPVLALLAAPSFADSFAARVSDALQTPNVVAGAKYLTTDPGAGVARVGFFLSANVSAYHVFDFVYVGGVGLNLSQVVPGLESAPGVGVSIPAVTYYPKGGRFGVQVGYGWDITSNPKYGGPYGGACYSWGSPASIAAKRAAKNAAKEKK